MHRVPPQRGLGIAVLVVTGLITVQAMASAIGILPTLTDTVSPGLTVDLSQGLGILGLVAWLLIAPWMATANRAARASGYPQKYRPWVAWWGWAIPIWNLWAPYRFMKDATQGFAVSNLGWWWATWLLGTITIWSSSESHMVDGAVVQTRTITSSPLNAIALTISWIVLARIVWTVSQGAGGDEPDRGLPAGPVIEF